MGRRNDVALTRSVIAKRALAILDAEGPEALTVRSLATALGVKSSSLYHHVDSKNAILDAIGDLIGSEIDLSPLLLDDWREAIRAFARTYRRAYLSHPAAFALIAPRPMESSGALGGYDAVVKRITDEGYAPANALELVAAIDYLVLGSVFLPFIEGFPSPAALDPTLYPSLAAAVSSVGSTTVNQDGFESGLAALLDGWPAPPG